MLPTHWVRNGFGRSTPPATPLLGPAGSLMHELMTPPRRTDWAPAMDVTETDAAYELLADLPGLSIEAFDITLLDGQLTITAERPAPAATEGRTMLHRERQFGRFTRTVELGAPVNEDEITATYIDGVLRLYVPKVPSARPRRIEITRG